MYYSLMYLKKFLLMVALIVLGAFAWQVGSYYMSPGEWVKLDNWTRMIFPFLPDEFENQNLVNSANTCTSQTEVAERLTDFLQIDLADELNILSLDDSIVKWREKANEPYRSYAVDAANEYIVADKSVEYFAEKIGDGQTIINLLGNDYEVYQPMNIPIYRYPSGELAKKIGIKRGNQRFLVGIYGTEIDGSDVNKNSRIKIHCAEPGDDLVRLYDNYLDLPHKYTSETSVEYEDLDNNLGRVNLVYPGAPTDYVGSEFWDTRSVPWKKVYEMGEFPPCAIFEKLGIGEGSSCFRPEKNEFSVVSY